MFKGIARWFRNRSVRRAALRERRASDRAFEIRLKQLGVRLNNKRYQGSCEYCKTEMADVQIWRRTVPPPGVPDRAIFSWHTILVCYCSDCGTARLRGNDPMKQNPLMSFAKFLDDLERKQDPYSVASRRVDEIQQELHRLEQRKAELKTELERERQEKQHLELEAPQSYREPPLLAGE